MTATTTLPVLSVEGLHAHTRDGMQVLRGIDLSVGAGEFHGVLGEDDHAARAFAKVLLGDPAYQVSAGRIVLDGEDVTFLAPDARAKLGMFLAFPDPALLAGVQIHELLRQAASARRGRDISAVEIRAEVRLWLERLGLAPDLADRPLDIAGSATDQTANEMLQMAVLEPELAILDETGASPGADGPRIVSALRSARPRLGGVVVAEDRRHLERFAPDRIHLLVDGHLADDGSPVAPRPGPGGDGPRSR